MNYIEKIVRPGYEDMMEKQEELFMLRLEKARKEKTPNWTPILKLFITCASLRGAFAHKNSTDEKMKILIFNFLL